jgi:hypothetical protein
MGSRAVFALDEGGDVFQRTRPVQRVHGDEVAELVGLQFTQVLLHPRAFELEGAVGLGALVDA